MRHSIDRINISITATGGIDGIALQQETSLLFWNTLRPKMEELFDRVSDENVIQVIDHLTIDLGNISSADWQAQYSEKLLQALQMALQPLEKPLKKTETISPLQENPVADQAFQISGEQRQSVRLRLFDIWLHFLQKGVLPPAATLPTNESEWRQAILETLAAETRAEQQLLHLIRQHPTVARRLAMQFEEGFLARIAAVLNRQSLEPLPLLRIQWQTAFAALTAAIPGSSSSARSPEIMQAMYAAPDFWHRYFMGVVATNSKNLTPEQAAALPFEQFLKTRPAPEVQSWQAAWQQILRPAKSGNPKQAQAGGRSLPPELEKVISEALAVARRITNSASNPVRQPASDAPAEQHVGDGAAREVPDAMASKPAADLSADPLQTPLYVQWAGVVLTHAFLPAFFKTLDLLDEQKQFKSTEAQQKAIHAIQFLANGEETALEYRLILPKLLCGLPPDHPIERAITLSDPEKAEADTLLRSLLAHWNALGSTSPAGLREGFFDRSGKLSKGQNGPLLHVESRTLDIMLQRLPWPLSLVRLPWMKEMLQVDWIY